MSDLRKAVAALTSVFLTGAAATASAADAGADDPGKALPTIYLDLRTYYSQVPTGAAAIGFGNQSLFNALQMLATASGAAVPGALPAAKSLNADLPMTIDVTDSVSLYAGISGSSTQFGGGGWSSFAVTSWNVGFQADVYQQNGRTFPTVTLQSTITQSIPNGTFGTTSFSNILELDYAFDQDETRGVLLGIQHTRADVNSASARINPNTIGYVGGYYQWPNNWKFTGRAGLQSFEGAQLSGLVAIPSFIQPIVRFDLDRMDDNDNRLFGLTAEIMWVPKPAYQLTLRTPLYAVKK